MIASLMRGALFVLIAIGGVFGVTVPGYAEEPIVVRPDQIEWRAVGDAGVEMAVLYGDPSEAGPYTVIIIR